MKISSSFLIINSKISLFKIKTYPCQDLDFFCFCLRDIVNYLHLNLYYEILNDIFVRLISENENGNRMIM